MSDSSWRGMERKGALLCLTAALLLTGLLRGSALGAGGAELEALRLGVADLRETFGAGYAGGDEFAARVEALGRSQGRGERWQKEFEQLRGEALLANPLLDFDGLIVLKRKRGQLGLPTNHQCNSTLARDGYENEIAVLSGVSPKGSFRTLYRPEGGRFVGEMDLDFDGERLLFTMSGRDSWEIFEIGADGGGLRQVSRRQEGVDNFDACYLPDGRIVFVSTASFTGVPCWHGKERACNVYLMNADGTGVRQLCFDQDLDLHPSVLPTGQVIFSRWDYTGIMHIYLRPLMVMNPDGTGQRAVYGSNSYWPNSLYYPRGIPGAPNKIAAIVSGYHGVSRMGELVLVDLTKGWREADGVVQRIPGRGKAIEPVIVDRLVNKSWPKFLQPYPLSDKYFVAAAKLDAKSPWGIYLVDVFDNIVPICVRRGLDLFEPIALRRSVRPPAIPDRVDLGRDDAVVYLHDVYRGPGLAGVPRGTIKRLRVLAYHFGYPGLAGPDKIGRAGPWEVMRIMGTVPVRRDGSSMFRVPANTPLAVQPLDGEGKAVQLMRSWFTAMPGEVVSCVGCHEQPNEATALRRGLAAVEEPVKIEAWYGPARGFDFEREVQPVLDEYCVGCHDGGVRADGRKPPDLRSESLVEGYRGLPLSRLGANRLHPEVREAFGGTNVRYTPAYEALTPYIRRVNIEDHVELLVPGEYHADTSELIQMLRKGHQGVRLDGEGWDRLVTWIDLNGPCHGRWSDLCGVPEGADRRRRAFALLYGGPAEDPEAILERARLEVEAVAPEVVEAAGRMGVKVEGWPFDGAEARRRQGAGDGVARTVDLGGGVSMRLVRIPAGEFVMGSRDGEADERPPGRVSIRRAFWMGAFEVTNEQYRRFDPMHESGVFAKRFGGINGPGLTMDGRRQPVVRVSRERAAAFCRWLSGATGMEFALPSEAQWEYACRAGTATELSYGEAESDFSGYANVADMALSRPYPATGGLALLLDIPSERRFDDEAVATADAGGYKANAWGLHDMHGNACEWTGTTYRAYPYDAEDGRERADEPGRKVVRGGSFYDRPGRCRSAFRLSYPSWQRMHNVGFRVVCEVEE